MIHVATTSGVEIIRTGMVDVAAESARRLTGTATVEMDTIAPVTRSQMALDYAREELSLNGEVLLLHDGERERDVGLRELEATVAYALRSGAPGAAISDDEVQSMAESVLASGCRTTAGEQVLRHVMDRLALFASCVAVVDKTGEALHSAAGAGAVELRPSIECGATKEREVWVRVRVPLIFHIFSTSGACGALAEDAKTGNVYRGVVMKFSEPADARKPTKKWRLYVFKGDQELAVLHISRQSAYLVGRDEKVADIKALHPSLSKQHAVIQFRMRPRRGVSAVETMVDGAQYDVLPYIMDLESTNGTLLNGKKIAAACYVELRARDKINFGNSSRDYVLLCAEH